MDTTCVVNRPLTSVAEEGRRPGVTQKKAQSILLDTPQLPKTIRRADHIIRAIPRPLGTNISCVVQFPQGQVFVSSPHHRSGLEGVLRSGQRTSTKTASFSPRGEVTKHQIPSFYRRPSIYLQSTCKEMVNTVDRDLLSKHESMADAAIRGRLATRAGPKRWRAGTRYPGISRLGTYTGRLTANS